MQMNVKGRPLHLVVVSLGIDLHEDYFGRLEHDRWNWFRLKGGVRELSKLQTLC